MTSLCSVACVALVAMIMISEAHLTFAQSAQTPPADTSRLSGYSSQSSTAERGWEKKLQDGIVPENLRQNMQR